MLMLRKPEEDRRTRHLKAEEDLRPHVAQARGASRNEGNGATCVQRACQAASRSTNLPNRSWNSCIGAMTACRSAPAGSLLAVSRRRRNVLIKSTISYEL